MTTQLTRQIARTVAHNTAWAGAALGSWALVAGLAPVGARQAPAPVTVDRVAVLVQRHGCWSGAQPEGAPEPTRAVITTPEGRVRVVEAEAGYAIWLEDSPGTLHAFCP